MLNCIVQGDEIRHAFLVKIERDMVVSDLKEIILKKAKLDISENKLVLWKVNIQIDDHMDLDTTICDDIQKKEEKQELFSLRRIDYYFKEDAYYSAESPDSLNIHIIVQPPPPATTGKCLPMVYLSNKKFALSHIFFISIREEKSC